MSDLRSGLGNNLELLGNRSPVNPAIVGVLDAGQKEVHLTGNILVGFGRHFDGGVR